MKTLAQEFKLASDGLSTHLFKQLKRTGRVCLYARYDLDKPGMVAFGYEVFVVNVLKKTAKWGTPGDETYPRSNAFGRTAWFCTTLDRAEARFAELTARQPILPSLV